MLFERSHAGIPAPFLAILIFWLTMIFVIFCLFSPLNPTSIVALILIALSASGAIFLILEMGQPFEGLMQISSRALRTALPPLAPERRAAHAGTRRLPRLWKLYVISGQGGT